MQSNSNSRFQFRLIRKTNWFYCEQFFCPSCALRCHLPSLFLLTLSLSSSICTHKNEQINLTLICGASFSHVTTNKEWKKSENKINILTDFFQWRKIKLFELLPEPFQGVCGKPLTKELNIVTEQIGWLVASLVSNLLQLSLRILSSSS